MSKKIPGGRGSPGRRQHQLGRVSRSAEDGETMNGNSSFSNSNSFASEQEAASLPWCFRAAMPVALTAERL